MIGLHDRIKQFRLSAGFTQQQLADKIGVKLNTVACYESGRNLPSIPILLKLSQALNVSIDILLDNEPFNKNYIADEALIALLNDAGFGIIKDNDYLYLTIPMMSDDIPDPIDQPKLVFGAMVPETLRKKVVWILEQYARHCIAKLLKYRSELDADLAEIESNNELSNESKEAEKQVSTVVHFANFTHNVFEKEFDEDTKVILEHLNRDAKRLYEEKLAKKKQQVNVIAEEHQSLDEVDHDDTVDNQ